MIGGGRSDEAALMGVALAGVVTLVLAPGPFDWLSTVVGLTLLFILAAYDPLWDAESDHLWVLRRRFFLHRLLKHLAFSAVYALLIFMTLGILLNLDLIQDFIRWLSPKVGAFHRTNAEIICRAYGETYRCRQEPFRGAFTWEAAFYFAVWLVPTVLGFGMRCRWAGIPLGGLLSWRDVRKR